MGHRLTKIATRTGDAGETGLGDGKRVAKDGARVQALGDIDELNSALGLLLAEKLPADIRKALPRSSTTCSTWGAKPASRATRW